ncbi:MAG: DUF4350 domain-containing protein [Kangiellaceae bacterium]|nr:DUF4350 domain-containing protein [Kangiellaceae bacterium]
MAKRISISPATWVICAFALIIGGYSYWFYSNFDRVINEVDLGAIKEVKANPFFAAQKLLQNSGRTAKTERNFSVLDNELQQQDTLIIESTRVGLAESKRLKINDWLKEGGHLILLATEIYDNDLGTSRDVLLDELGIRLYENPVDSWSYDEDERLTKVTFEDFGDETSIDFDQNFYLQDSSGDSTFIGGNDYSDLFAQFKLGEGMITVVTDMDIWKNYSIDDYDHAMFLYQLIGTGEAVLFLYNTAQPSLWSIMRELIPMVIISFFIFIFLALFSASWRKGTPKADERPVQREIMQHLVAAGEFTYRNDSGETLLQSMMDSLETRLRRSIHQYSGLSDSQKINKVSQLVNIKKKQLELLWQIPEHTQEDFLLRVVLIQKIKRLL